MRRRSVLTARGFGAILVAVACLAAGYQFNIVGLRFFAIFFFVIVIASVFSLFLARRPDDLRRTLTPDVSTAGRVTAVRLRLSQRRSTPGATVAWDDALSPGLDAFAGGELPDARVASDGSQVVDIEYLLRTNVRGVRRLGPLGLTVTDAFGFAQRTLRVGPPVDVVVAPAIVDLPPLAESAGEAGGSLHTAAHQLGQGADNLVPRGYVPGDSMRRIHWRASAHRDELMVRQEEQETTPDAIVVVDLGVRRWSPLATGVTGDDPAFELAISAAVSAVARLVHEGYDVTILDGAGRALAETIDSGDGGAVESLAIALATTLATRDALSELAGLFAGSMTGPVVLVTGSLTPADVAAIAPIASHSTFPVLLAVGPRSASLDAAEAGGWRVGVAEHDADLALAWARATDRGTGHVGA